MPEIEIRPAVQADIPQLAAIDHDYSSDFVWQMEVQSEEGQIGVSFRQIRLPRSVRVGYPRTSASLLKDWTQRSGLLVAVLEGHPIGYISLMLNVSPATTWVSDLVVIRRLRRQGVGSALLLAAQEWGRQHRTYRITIEMQPKNHPAILFQCKS